MVSIPAGMGDMAVSNSIGSNVFDILIGLGLPWALQTLAVNYGSYVSPTSVHIIIFIYLDTFRKKNGPKFCRRNLKKEIALLCYDLGEVAINCQWTFPILWRTSTSISSLKPAVCAEIR